MIKLRLIPKKLKGRLNKKGNLIQKKKKRKKKKERKKRNLNIIEVPIQLNYTFKRQKTLKTLSLYLYLSGFRTDLSFLSLSLSQQFSIISASHSRAPFSLIRIICT